MSDPEGHPPRALIIDDEPQIRRLLRLVLEAEGYHVSEAATGGEGLLAAAQYPPDVVLLDLGLPDMEGLDALRRLREWSPVPVIILSVRDQEAAKVAALDLGADDYVTKPFSTPELLARLRAARRHQTAADPPVVTLGNELVIDLTARRVRRHGEDIRLSPTEYQVLRVLARHCGRVVTHRQLLHEVWGPHVAQQELTHYLRVYIAHLRQKIESNPASPRWILTEPAIGYRLAAESSES